MKRSFRWILPLVAATALPAMTGCGHDEHVVRPAPEPTVVVTGEVTEVVDLVPTDGGVTITVRTREGVTELLQFPSLYTYPPPSQTTVQLYEVVRLVRVGDRVVARGTRFEHGIALAALTILRSADPR